jgi:hypothetical protein
VDAGFEPVQRDSLYGIVRRPDVGALLGPAAAAA